MLLYLQAFECRQFLFFGNVEGGVAFENSDSVMFEIITKNRSEV